MMFRDKGGGYLDIFLFMIVGVIIVLFSVVFIYMGSTVSTELHDAMDDMEGQTNVSNYTQLIDDNIGAVNSSYTILYWVAVFILIGMIVAIFIGSYLVTTKPVFFIPYIFIMITAIVVSVGISTGYEMMMANELLSSTFAHFLGANFILANLPIWVSIVGIGGGIIMYIRMKQGEQEVYGYGYDAGY